MNIVEAYRASKDGRIARGVWGPERYMKWNTSRWSWESEKKRPCNLEPNSITADDWEPYVEEKPETPEETPEEMMRRVARAEIERAVIEYITVNGAWVRDRRWRVVPGDSDE